MVRFKSKQNAVSRYKAPSQFHYGSIQILKKAECYLRVMIVSIPLWFDSNHLRSVRWEGKALSQFHYGSIQINRRWGRHFSNIWVSIPLWFDSNSQNVTLKLWNANSSQFHYGSIQIMDCSSYGIVFCSLNSTMVRFKYLPSVAREILLGASQFHYGSIQMSGWINVTREYKRVSIPLWFDSNVFCCLVIFIVSNLSQFHYGSIQMEDIGGTWLTTPSSQFHYGSIQIGNIQALPAVAREMSQFHYGSIQILK